MVELPHSDRIRSLSGIGLLAVISISALYSTYQATASWTTFNAALPIVLLFLVNANYWLFITPWAYDRPNSRLIMLWVQALATFPLYFLLDSVFTELLGIIWVVQVADTRGHKATILAALLSTGLLLSSILYHWESHSPIYSASLFLIISAFQYFAIITTYRERKELLLREELTCLNKALTQARNKIQEQARQSERLRIARDLHRILDDLSSAQVIELEKALEVTSGAASEKTRQALSMSQMLIQELNAVVDELGDDHPINFQSAIEQLTSNLPGLHTEISISANLAEIQIADTLLRCTKEAVTNILRHSNATCCGIKLNESETGYLLRVTDNGSTIRSKITPGNGLLGMEERILQIGGEVDWKTTESGGLSVSIAIPKLKQDLDFNSDRLRKDDISDTEILG